MRRTMLAASWVGAVVLWCSACSTTSRRPLTPTEAPTNTPTFAGSQTFSTTRTQTDSETHTVSATVTISWTRTDTRTATDTATATDTVNPSFSQTPTALFSATTTPCGATATVNPSNITLISGTPVANSAGSQIYSAGPLNTHWDVMAVRPVLSADSFFYWGYLDCTQTSISDFSCFGAGRVNCMAWNGNNLTTSCVKGFPTLQFGGACGYQMEWVATANMVAGGTNGPFNANASDIVLAWDTALVSGTSYTFAFSAPASMHLFLFNPNSGAPNPNAQAAFWPAGYGTYTTGGGSFSFTPTSSQNHGLVLTNDAAASSTTITITRTP